MLPDWGLPFSSHRTVASLPSHLSPVLCVVPSHNVNELSFAFHPPSLKYVPTVAFLPAARDRNGWMWMRPSPWVWMPSASSNCGAFGSHWPQTFTPIAACQWSWLTMGGVSALLFRLNAMVNTPATMMTPASAYHQKPLRPRRAARTLARRFVREALPMRRSG